jgi:hypothetical protein
LPVEFDLSQLKTKEFQAASFALFGMALASLLAEAFL